MPSFKKGGNVSWVNVSSSVQRKILSKLPVKNDNYLNKKFFSSTCYIFIIYFDTKDTIVQLLFKFMIGLQV